MTTVQQVYEVMQRLAPPELAEHWDNPGLLVDCGGAVRRVLVTLDITPEVVAEAAAKQCTVIVAHHPVIFDPLKRRRLRPGGRNRPHHRAGTGRVGAA